MIRSVFYWLPTPLLRLIALRFCQRMPMGPAVVVSPRPGVFFEVKQAKPEVQQ